MKLHCKIGLLFFAAFLAACTPFPSESERVAEAMRQAEAVYGDGNLLVETDTALFIPSLAEASDYYARKKQYAKAALAELYNGYTEKDFDKEAAMASFKEAECYGELAGDSLTMARAEYWMGKFLIGEGRKEEAFSAFVSSGSLIGNRYIDKAVIKNGLAVTYMLMGQYDSAEYHLQNSFKVAQEEQCDQLIWKNLNNLSVLYRIQGEYDKSLDCLREITERIHLDSVKTVFVFLNMRNTFMAKGEVDSAELYYRLLENTDLDALKKSDTKAAVFNSLQMFAESQGDFSLALRYSEKAKDALYEVMLQRQQQAVYRIQKQYDYETLQNTMSKKIIRRQRIILAFGLLLLVLSVVILVLQHQHNQMLKSEEELRRKLDSLKKDLRQTVDASVVDKVVVSQLRTILVANHVMHRTQNTKNEWFPLLFEVMGGKDNVFEAAKTVIEVAYPTLFSAILEKHPNLSDTEAKVCLMSCFDLTNAEIAELLDLSTNTINQNRSTLRKKLSLGSEKMSEQLRNLIAK